MQRHRNDEVEMFVGRQSAFEEATEHGSERLHALILEEMNQLEQRAFRGT